MYQFILVICCSFVTANAAQYFISDNEITRKQAMDNCTLATPDITVTSGVYSITDASLIDVPDGVTNLWLGYARAYRIFHYKGCLEFNPNVKAAKVVKLEADIGLCYSTCSRSSYFGLQSDGSSSKCYCFDSEPQKPSDWTGRACMATCSNPNDTACGGIDLISLYEIVPHNTLFANEQNTSTNCLLYQPTDPIGYRWKSCTRSLAAPCLDSDGNISTDEGGHTWIDAANKCFATGQYTMAYHKTYPQKGFVFQVWSGMLRGQFHIQMTDPSFSDVRIVGYVYYHTASNRVKLARGDQFIAHALCVKGDKNKDTTEDNSSGSGDKNVDKTEDNSSDSVYVYVAVPIALIVVVGITAGIAVYIRKRKHDVSGDEINMTSRDNGYTDPAKIFSAEPRGVLTAGPTDIRVSNYERIPDGMLVQHNAYETDADIDVYNVISDDKLDRLDNANNTQNVYYKLEKTDNTASTAVRHGAGYDDETDSAYDKTGHVARKPGETENVYNTATFPDTEDSNDTYNHTGDDVWKQDDGAYNKTSVSRATETVAGEIEALDDSDSKGGQANTQAYAEEDDPYSKAKF